MNYMDIFPALMWIVIMLLAAGTMIMNTASKQFKDKMDRLEELESRYELLQFQMLAMKLSLDVSNQLITSQQEQLRRAWEEIKDLKMERPSDDVSAMGKSGTSAAEKDSGPSDDASAMGKSGTSAAEKDSGIEQLVKSDIVMDVENGQYVRLLNNGAEDFRLNGCSIVQERTPSTTPSNTITYDFGRPVLRPGASTIIWSSKVGKKRSNGNIPMKGDDWLEDWEVTKLYRNAELIAVVRR